MKKHLFVLFFFILLSFLAFSADFRVDVISPNPATVNGTIVIRGSGFYGGSNVTWNKSDGGTSPGKVFLGDRELEVILYSDSIIVAIVPVGAVSSSISIVTPQKITIQGGFLDIISSGHVYRKNYSFMEREEYLPPAWGYYYYGGSCGWNWFVTPFYWNRWDMWGDNGYSGIYYHRNHNGNEDEFFLGYMPYFGWSYFWW